MLDTRGTSIADFREFLSYKRKITEYHAYKYRFVIASVYTIGCICNAIQWFEFIPILTNAKNVFGVSSTSIQFSLIIISQIAYAPAVFFSNYMTSKLGFKNSIILASFLTFLGAGVRCLCQFNYNFLLIGSIFGSLARPFFASNCGKISAVWFPTHERTISTSVIMCVYNLGNAIGSQLPQIVGNTTELSGIVNMLYISTGACGISFLLNLIFFKEEPPSPPSKGAKKPKIDVKESLKATFASANLSNLIISCAVFQGVVIAVTSTMDLLFEPLGLTSDQISDIVTYSTFIGIGQSLVLAVVLTKFQKYKAFCFLARFVTTICYGLVIYAAYISDLNLMYIALILFSSLGTCANPATFEMISEIAFPISDFVTASLFTLGYGTVGGGFSLVMDNLIGDPPIRNHILVTLYVFLGLSIVTLFAFLFVKELYKRTAYELKGTRGLDQLEVTNVSGNLDIDFRYTKF